MAAWFQLFDDPRAGNKEESKANCRIMLGVTDKAGAPIGTKYQYRFTENNSECVTGIRQGVCDGVAGACYIRQSVRLMP
jgi:hypothetical protein